MVEVDEDSDKEETESTSSTVQADEIASATSASNHEHDLVVSVVESLEDEDISSRSALSLASSTKYSDQTSLLVDSEQAVEVVVHRVESI